MTVLVRPQGIGNWSVQDDQTGVIIVDAQGYILNGSDQVIANVPTVADFVSTPKTQTMGIKEAINYVLQNKIPKIKLIGKYPNNTFTYNSNDTFDFTPINDYNFAITGSGNSIGEYIYFPTNSGITINNIDGMSLVFKGIGLETDGGNITINGIPGSNISNTVFLDHVIFGGLNGYSVMTINNTMVVGTGILLSDPSAPSLILNSCYSSFDTIMNSGFIQANNTLASDNDSGTWISIGVYQILYHSTLPLFNGLDSIHIGHYITQQMVPLAGTIGEMSIDLIDMIGGDNSNGTNTSIFSGTATIKALSIKNIMNTFQNEQPLPVFDSNITISNFDIKATPAFAYSTPAPTSGTVTIYLINYGSSYKKYIIEVGAYVNDTTTNQTINLPFAFSGSNLISGNNTGLTILPTTNEIIINSPNSTTPYYGFAILEGY